MAMRRRNNTNNTSSKKKKIIVTRASSLPTSSSATRWEEEFGNEKIFYRTRMTTKIQRQQRSSSHRAGDGVVVRASREEWASREELLEEIERLKAENAELKMLRAQLEDVGTDDKEEEEEEEEDEPTTPPPRRNRKKTPPRKERYREERFEPILKVNLKSNGRCRLPRKGARLARKTRNRFGKRDRRTIRTNCFHFQTTRKEKRRRKQAGQRRFRTSPRS